MKKYSIIILNVCLIHFLLGLDINIVSVSLPSVASHFNISVNIVSRIVWLYFLVLTCFLLAFGKLGDIKGFKKIYTLGIFIFLSGSIFCYLSNDFNLLVIARVYQAFGSAVLFALTPAIIASEIPAEMRGKVYGINYSFTALGGIIGRAASGYIISSFGWNSIFAINIPIGIITLFFTIKYLHNIHSGHDNIKFDIKGTIYIFISLFAFLFALNSGEEYGWSSILIISLLAAAIIFFTIFVYSQKKISYPLLDIKILKQKTISYPIAAFVFVYIITNGMIYITPFLLQWIKGYSKQESGLLMAIPSALQFFSGYISGYLSDKNKTNQVRITSLLMIAISIAAYTFINPQAEKYLIIIILSLYGFAIGFFIPSNTNSIMTSAAKLQKGITSSIMTTSVRLGSALGIVLFGAIFTLFVPEKNPLQSGVEITRLLDAFKYTFLFGSLVAILGLILIYFSGKKVENFRN